MVIPFFIFFVLWQVHEDRMRAIRFYSEIHINQALERVSLYEEMNREHPGYFDMTICCGMGTSYFDTLTNCIAVCFILQH